ncbi:hypothetical protein [Halorarum halobium]|uniref:hypothetical protein n=1 Tax=Halorarum halobium TaxID=3075121 RepID=UPI0028A768E4|nr:hypothetical protein [Halobaculum sp. XH14]
MGEAADPAEVWLVATFNLVAFALPLLILGHASGGLADVLPQFGTLPGLAGFGYLWLLLWLSTRWVFAEGGLVRSEAGETGRLLLRGTLGGALVGMGFVVGIALVIAAVNVVVDGMVDVAASAFLLLIGAAGGAIVGLAVGLLFGLVDVVCYRLSGALVPNPDG